MPLLLKSFIYIYFSFSNIIFVVTSLTPPSSVDVLQTYDRKETEIKAENQIIEQNEPTEEEVKNKQGQRAKLLLISAAFLLKLITIFSTKECG